MDPQEQRALIDLAADWRARAARIEAKWCNPDRDAGARAVGLHTAKALEICAEELEGSVTLHPGAPDGREKPELERAWAWFRAHAHAYLDQPTEGLFWECWTITKPVVHEGGNSKDAAVLAAYRAADQEKGKR